MMQDKSGDRHLTELELVQFLNDQLDVEWANDHVERCLDCQKRLAEFCAPDPTLRQWLMTPNSPFLNSIATA